MNDKIFMRVVYAALLSTPRPYIYVKVVTRLIKMFVSYSVCESGWSNLFE